MRIIFNAMESMLTTEIEEECVHCESKFAYLLDEVQTKRTREWFLFIPLNKYDRDFYVQCPVCKGRLYQRWCYSREEVRYLVKKDREALKAEKRLSRM